MDQLERIERPAGDLAVRGGIGAFADRRARVGEKHGPAAGQVHFRMRLQETQLFLQALWICDIVGIHARNIFAAGAFDALVQARSQLEPPLVAPHHDARIVE